MPAWCLCSATRSVYAFICTGFTSSIQQSAERRCRKRRGILHQVLFLPCNVGKWACGKDGWENDLFLFQFHSYFRIRASWYVIKMVHCFSDPKRLKKKKQGSMSPEYLSTTMAVVSAAAQLAVGCVPRPAHRNAWATEQVQRMGPPQISIQCINTLECSVPHKHVQNSFDIIFAIK